MPEGPEVRVITRQLRALVRGKVLQRIEVNPLFARRASVQETKPRKVSEVFCRGKNIFLRLEDGHYLRSHLGMTGHWRREAGKHTMVTLYFGNRILYYDDMRRFGYFQEWEAAEYERFLKTLGLDIFSDTFTWEYFRRVLPWRSRAVVGAVLKEQNYLCGIGNYLRADILYVAKLNPWIPLQRLSEDEKRALYQAIRAVSQKSYRAGGTTIQTYRDLEMHQGGYQPLVYGRSEDEAGREVKCATLGGQTMYWCPEVQPAPN